VPHQEYFWWWRASRVINTVVGGQFLDRTINEFPFFSFLLGDLHAHYMALPFGLLALAFSMNFLWEPGRLSIAWARGNALTLGLSALCLGGLAFLNTWDFPIYGFVLVAALGMQASRVRNWWGWMGIACLIVFSALFLYLPFYVSFQSQASGILPMMGVGTRPLHYIIFWGLFIFIIVSFVLAKLGGELRRAPVARRTVLWAILPPLVPFLVWCLLEIAFSALGGGVGEGVMAILLKFLGLLPLLALLAVTLFIALRWLGRGESSSSLFALVLAFTGILLTVGVELFYISDLFANRMNTVFKLYYIAWAMLAVASAFGVYAVGSMWRGVRGWRRGLGVAWWLVLALLVAGSLLYPIGGIHTKIRYCIGSPTLDGMAFLEGVDPQERRAIEWLNGAIEGTPVILEAWGPDFTEFGRVSAYTGLPTLLGWSAHEWQWRGSREGIEEREKDIALIYQSRDVAQTRALLDKYGVSFVYVGRLERTKYGEEVLGKFDSFMDIAFKNKGVTIYQVRDTQ
jgi:YYY domain-containing protein